MSGERLYVWREVDEVLFRSYDYSGIRRLGEIMTKNDNAISDRGRTSTG